MDHERCRGHAASGWQRLEPQRGAAGAPALQGAGLEPRKGSNPPPHVLLGWCRAPRWSLGGSLHKGLTVSLLRGGSSPGQTRTPCPAFQIWVSPLVAVPGWSLMGCHISAIPPEQSHVWNLNIRIMGLDNLASLKVCKYCM